jgi:hypothetical protein
LSTDRWVGIITPFRDEATGARWLSEISRTFAVADDDEGRDGNAMDDPVLARISHRSRCIGALNLR